ncbi:hypothetical protein HG536_0G04020 [Torulaspora globosa]|uniref:Chromatin modification-related protein EAF3 n=1 Tax=Torulaspora globosa TaxID=48254 RepID=A0A7G3ZM04_9SACH|nr:uncharacterized protein HG536_0G04020 [Torulaspora globosa]QLL34540.1 hypothetical protein HG536_0G04020 [Torulaspora globosa]
MFEIGGKCLAYHGPMLYEAKILRVWDPESEKVSVLREGQVVVVEEESDEGASGIPGELLGAACYFVHYQGWKSTWDEWIGPARILEYNEENLALKRSLVEEARNAKRLQQEQQRRKKASGSSSGAGSRRGRPEAGKGAGKKGGNANGVAGGGAAAAGGGDGALGRQEGASQPPAPRIILHIPVKLKSLLVDDWEFVTKDKKICQLPSPTMTVQQTLDSYEEAAANRLESPAAQAQLSEYCAGLRLYFERSLPILLLYRLERLQYDEVLKKQKFKDMAFCDIYGPIHLLRLLSVLPELMATTTMDAQGCQLIVKQTESLLEWLVVNMDELFDTENSRDYYINTSSQYEGVALGM